jgi:translation initiation factor 2B subunit (eIF-2B alpha/beta/delta family)
MPKNISLHKKLDTLSLLEQKGVDYFCLGIVDLLLYEARTSKAHTHLSFLHTLTHLKKKTISHFPHNPFIHNLFVVLFSEFPTEKRKIIPYLQEKKKFLSSFFSLSLEKMTTSFSKMITAQNVLLLQGFDRFVLSALIALKESGKKFTICVVESGGDESGKKTSTFLAQHNIPVFYLFPSQLEEIFHKIDVVLLLNGLICPKNIFVSHGGQLISSLAHSHNVRTYFCAHSWSFLFKAPFGKHIPYLNSSIVWEKKPKKISLTIPLLDTILLKNIKGILSERGMFSHSIFVEDMERKGLLF